MSYETSKIRDARNNVVVIEHPVLPDQPQTFLTSSASASDVTLTVADNVGFSNTDKIIVGMVGSDQTEVSTISGAVSPGTSVSNSALVFPHPINTPVRKTLWDQVEISGSSTITGSKTVINTVSIQFGSQTTDFVVTGTTYTYYFARFKNSTSGVFSSYSDASPASGYSSDTVRQIKQEALRMTGQSIGDIITDDFLNTAIVNCETELYVLGPGKRWAHFLVNDFSLGSFAAGETKFAMPSDIADSDTGEALQELHTRQVTRLRRVEKDAVDDIRWDVALTTLASQALAGDTSVTLTDAGDFTDTGSIRIGSDSPSYTARSTTTDILSGIPASGTGSITTTHAAGTNVWQGGQVDMTPSMYFVYPGFIELPLPPNAAYLGQNLYCSYYSKPVYPNSDADTVNFPDVSVYHNYLAWKIQLRLSNGVANPTTEGLKNDYTISKEKMLGRARLQDSPKFIPRSPRSRRTAGLTMTNQPVYWRII